MNKSTVFFWKKAQAKSFNKLKELCAEACTLAYYDVKKSTVIQCDASSFGLGAALVQEDRVIAYSSRALNSTEQNYSQIQKELKAIEHACEKFHTYIYAKPVSVETDHQPLELIFRKPIHKAPKRLQPMLLRLSIYDLTVKYKKGKLMYLADTLSRAPLQETEETSEEEIMVHKVSISGERLTQFRQYTMEELSSLVTTILEGWPEERSQVPDEVKPFWNFREELDYADGVVYKGERLVIPPSMRKYVLKCIHNSHMGIEKCKSRARDSCYWPGINQQIEQVVENCHEYQVNQRRQQAQPMTLREIPERPWSHCASDLFEFEKQHFVIIADYFSKWIAVEKLETETTTSVVTAMMTIFTTHGFPDKLTSDNGPQYSSSEFKQFCKENNITHVTVSPHYPQSNGEAERAVGTIKHLWKKADDEEKRRKAVMEYNATPFSGTDMSPAQMLMGRRLKTNLIINSELLKPKAYSLELVRHKLEKLQLKTKQNYDKDARKEHYDDLKPGDTVLFQTPSALKKQKWQPAKVVVKHPTPQSYIIDTGDRRLRRNRIDLRKSSEHFQPIKVPDYYMPERTTTPSTNQKPSPAESVTTPIDTPTTRQGPSMTAQGAKSESLQYTTRSGRQVRTPAKFRDYVT